MSDENVYMSPEHPAPLFLADSGRLLDVDGNYSSSLSPESDSCNFNLSERRDCSSANNTFSTGGTMQQQSIDPRQKRLSTILENSNISTLDNGSICLWNEYFGVLSNQDSDERMNSAAASPDSVAMSSCGTSCRGSTDLSFSSEEMLIGSNSFVLEEQAVASGLSSLAESPASLVLSQAETKSLLSLLSEEEGVTFELGEEAARHCEDKASFISTFCPVEKPTFLSNSLADLSSSNSPSSGEMVFRSNSFILDEQAVASVVSSYEESPATSVKSHTESKLFLTPVCEKEGASEQKQSHPCLGVTFNVGDNIELPSEDNVSVSKSFLGLTSDKPSLHTTFLTENSPADIANHAQFIHSEADILNETYAVETPFQTMSPSCTVQDKNICTSTPLQHTGSNVPSLPSFAVSPCTDNTSSPVLRPLLRKRNPIVSKQFEKGVVTFSSSKACKMEMELNGVKCKRDVASSSASLDKQAPIKNNQEGHAFGSFRASPARKSNNTPCPHSNVSKAVQNSPRRLSLGRNKDQTNLQKGLTNSENLQIRCKTSARNSAAQRSPTSPDAGEGTSRQTRTDPKAHIANTFCFPEKSPPKEATQVSKPTPKENMTVNGKSVCKTQNTCPYPGSESSGSRQLRMGKPQNPQKPSASFTLRTSKTEHLKSQSKPVSLGNSSNLSEGAMVKETNCRKVQKIGLVSNLKTSTASSSANTNARVRGPLSPNPASRVSTSKAPAASPIMMTPLNTQKSGTSGRESSRAASAVGTPLSKQKPTGTLKATGETPGAVTPRTKTKPAPFKLVQTTPRSSLMGPPLTPAPRQQHKAFGSTSNHNNINDRAGTAQVLTAPCKSVPTTRGLSKALISPPKRVTSAKLIRLSTPVDKNKPKAGARPQQQQVERGPSRPQQGSGAAQDVGPAGVAEARIRHLQAQLAQSHHRFEALAVVLQQALAQRDEAVRQSRGRSQELLELRGELMHTVNRSECLAQEKEALKASLQEALDQVQAQHQRDLADLEQRLRDEHQKEISVAQQQMREEQERSRERLQRQLEELSVAHQTMRLELEQSHGRELQSARERHQLALQELSDTHTHDLQSLNKTLQDAEMVLNEKIQILSQENAALMEKLEEEKKNRDISQKDSHTLYLEQELESLKVVLEMKTKQLHQQEKKLMEVDKLSEKSVKLEETLVKVQQENEDLKARMEKHTALSRQLSTEQAQLQESLKKESKVNKRLSMENEELLWKLHNGDLSSPRKSSPNPPSPHFSLGSPRPPSLFTSPPVSPR